jgi:hypothetical protein
MSLWVNGRALEERRVAEHASQPSGLWGSLTSNIRLLSILGGFSTLLPAALILVVALVIPGQSPGFNPGRVVLPVALAAIVAWGLALYFLYRAVGDDSPVKMAVLTPLAYIAFFVVEALVGGLLVLGALVTGGLTALLYFALAVVLIIFGVRVAGRMTGFARQ